MLTEAEQERALVVEYLMEWSEGIPPSAKADALRNAAYAIEHGHHLKGVE